MEAMRCVKRRLSDIVFQTMLNDAVRTTEATTRTGPVGHRETTLAPARPDHIPTPALRTSHFPDPPDNTLELHSLLRLDTEGCQIRMPVPGGGGSRRETLASVARFDPWQRRQTRSSIRYSGGPSTGHPSGIPVSTKPTRSYVRRARRLSLRTMR